MYLISERQKLVHESTTMRETVDSMVDQVFDSLPKKIRRLSESFDHSDRKRGVITNAYTLKPFL